MRCDQHDYLEIACTYRLTVCLGLHSGDRVQGVAMDTGYTPNRQECLWLQQGGNRLAVPTAALAWMEAVDNRHYFTRVEFG